MPISNETARHFLDQINHFIERGTRYTEELVVTKDKRIVYRDDDECVSLDDELETFIPQEHESESLAVLATALDKRLKSPEDYTKQHIEKLSIPCKGIEQRRIFAKSALNLFPLDKHKLLTLGRQNLLINACLKNIIEPSKFQESVIPRPVQWLTKSVKECLKKDNEHDRDISLNAVFNKIIPEKVALKGKKLVIIRDICTYHTMHIVIPHLEKYLESKGIDYCFFMLLPGNADLVSAIKRDDPDHFASEHKDNEPDLLTIAGKNIFDTEEASGFISDSMMPEPTKKTHHQNKFYHTLPTQDCDFNEDPASYTYMDVVVPPCDDYLCNDEVGIWSFPENPINNVVTNHIVLNILTKLQLKLETE